MIKLIGSEKQVKWAVATREEVIALINRSK